MDICCERNQKRCIKQGRRRLLEGSTRNYSVRGTLMLNKCTVSVNVESTWLQLLYSNILSLVLGMCPLIVEWDRLRLDQYFKNCAQEGMNWTYIFKTPSFKVKCIYLWIIDKKQLFSFRIYWGESLLWNSSKHLGSVILPFPHTLQSFGVDFTLCLRNV